MRLIAILLSGILITQMAMADAIPSQSDPALQDAITDWPAEDDPIDALREIGVLAAGGNIVA